MVWRGKRAFVLLVLLGLIVAGLWWHADSLLAWYYVRQLAGAAQEQRDAWARRVVSLDAAAVPRLLDQLADADAQRCANIGLALAALAQQWGAEDAQGLRLLHELSRRFAGLSGSGQVEALQAAGALLGKQAAGSTLPASVTQEVGALLTAADKRDHLRRPALELAAALLERVPAGQWRDRCRDWAVAGLAATDCDTRLAAIQLALREPLRKDQSLLALLVPHLKDESAGVRKAALVALGHAREVLGDDDLLPLLHDHDMEVQGLCAIALRSRGLSDQQIELARLISDPRPEARLQVLHFLHGEAAVEPGVWLRRLSQDEAPAVRAAAARAASGQTRVDLRDRLRDMALQDPSPTVRELAGHYFERHQRNLQALSDE